MKKNILDSRTTAEKQESRQSTLLENCYMIRDTIVLSDGTKDLYKLFTDMLTSQAKTVLAEMGAGQHLATSIPFEEKDFWKHVGIVEGLGWLEDTITWMINKAIDDERKDDE